MNQLCVYIIHVDIQVHILKTIYTIAVVLLKYVQYSIIIIILMDISCMNVYTNWSHKYINSNQTVHDVTLLKYKITHWF